MLSSSNPALTFDDFFRALTWMSPMEEAVYWDGSGQVHQPLLLASGIASHVKEVRHLSDCREGDRILRPTKRNITGSSSSLMSKVLSNHHLQ